MQRDISAPPTTDDLRRAIATIVGTEPGEITGDANLVYLGLGSLEMMRLVTRWRRQGIAVEFGELAAEPTVDAWQRHLRAAWEAGQVKTKEAAR